VLVDVSVVGQRFQPVLAVRAGVPVVEVADQFGVSRQSVHNWLAAYLVGRVSRCRVGGLGQKVAPAGLESVAGRAGGGGRGV
jgi:hypothetical protein